MIVDKKDVERRANPDRRTVARTYSMPELLQL